MVAGDSDATSAMNLLVLCRRLYLDDFPYVAWVDWAPRPQIAPVDQDARAGNTLFEGTLAWMLRHEIAHIACRHNERQIAEGLATKAIELEADSQATEWFKEQLTADPNRQLTTPPNQKERQLETRGLFLGLGLVWVAMLEASLAQRGSDYPSPAERLFACLGQLGLREDSAAAQWIPEFIHAWIDPQADWGPAGGHRDAQAFFSEAVYRLHRYLAEAEPKAA
jgi:Peptidase U49